MHDDIVRRIQPLPLEFFGDYRDRSVRLVPDNAPSAVFTGKLTAFVVERIAVAIARWLPERRHARVVLDPPELDVVWNIAPDEIFSDAIPRRPFGPERARVQPPNRRVAHDIPPEAGRERHHVGIRVR